MKALWVTNVAIGEICEHAGLPSPASGGWMEALLAGFVRETGDDVVVLTTADRSARLATETATYRLVGCGDIYHFRPTYRNLALVRQVIDQERPDIIHVWGTEYPFALAVLECAPTTPAVVFVQGLVDTVARYYDGGLPNQELRRAVSAWDVVQRNTVWHQKRRYQRAAAHESAILRRCGHVMSENGWVDAHCRAIAPDVSSHYCTLALRPEFGEAHWTWEGREPRTIMCNAGGYPLKGLHMLLQSLRLVADGYPDVRLMVPGGDMTPPSRFGAWVRQGGYAMYIRRLVRDLGLTDNVAFLGALTPTQMADAMRRSSVFVMPSAIENQSSTLREAMTVGVPCVASYVGGIPDYVVHGENGLLYRFQEYEMLAELIRSVLHDRELSERLSTGGRATARRLGDLPAIRRRTSEIYAEVVAAGTGAYPAG